ncbi:MAG TPA: hypothetical protein VKS60_21220 [Stellaceae bacterium]|nr:hypothetical protein [Stellaceae bacterium]
MADIIIAEFGGGGWLVGGETHIDDLLMNTLPPGMTVEVIACASMDEVMEIWVSHGGRPEEGGDPWMIHPGIVNRERRHGGDFAVRFGEWSAMIDQAALGVIAAAAAAAARSPDAAVVLTEYLDPIAPAMIADLSRLRAQLIEQRLVEAGLARNRVCRSLGDPGAVQATGQDKGRIDIVIRAV